MKVMIRIAIGMVAAFLGLAVVLIVDYHRLWTLEL
jgi:hypothetical protein